MSVVHSFLFRIWTVQRNHSKPNIAMTDMYIISVSNPLTATINQSLQTHHTPSLMYVKLNAPSTRDGVQTYSLPSALIHLAARECPFSLDLPEETQAMSRKTSQVGEIVKNDDIQSYREKEQISIFQKLVLPNVLCIFLLDSWFKQLTYY